MTMTAHEALAAATELLIDGGEEVRRALWRVGGTKENAQVEALLSLPGHLRELLTCKCEILRRTPAVPFIGNDAFHCVACGKAYRP